MTDSSSHQFRLSIRKVLLYVAIGATLATLALSAGQLVKSGTNSSLPAAEARPSPVIDSTTPTQKSPAPFATDERGFINSAARCDDTQTTDAIGRTYRSLVVICVDPNGEYEYRGVRLSDDAALRVATEPTSEGGFVVRNEGVTYAVSPTELLVTAGEKVLFREPMIEFDAPRLPTEAGPAAPPPPTTTPSR